MEWRDIIGYEGVYQINRQGKVRRVLQKSGTQSGRILRDFDNGKSYRYITLSKNSVPRNHYIHILLATAFIPNPENKPQVNHRNGVKSDNWDGNLEWVTLPEQMAHAYVSGLLHPRTKLTAIEVNEIRGLHARGGHRPSIAKQFNISEANLHRIIHREIWRYV